MRITNRHIYELTSPQQDEVATLRESGWSCAQIAQKLRDDGTACSTHHVRWMCLRDGIEPPAERLPTLSDVGPTIIVTKNGGRIIRFSNAEDAKMLTLRRGGMRPTKIADKLHRARSSVAARLLFLARHEEVAARFAARHRHVPLLPHP